MSKREVKESPLNQATDERIAYVFDFSNIGTPTLPAVDVWELGTNENVSDETLEGDPSVEGDEVTTPIVHSLTAGKRYHLVCRVVIEGNTVSAFAVVSGEIS